MCRYRKEILVLDSDLISSFLWVNKAWILKKLYRDRIILPKIVAKELGRVEKLDSKLKEFERGSGVKIKRLSPKESVDFCRLAQSKSNNIGAGEAAVIAMASSMKKDSKNIGVIGSNNLSDVVKYSKERKIKIMTTGKILIEVERRDILSKKQIEKIWRSMIRYNIKLGAKSYEKFKAKEKRREVFY